MIPSPDPVQDLPDVAEARVETILKAVPIEERAMDALQGRNWRVMKLLEISMRGGHIADAAWRMIQRDAASITVETAEAGFKRMQQREATLGVVPVVSAVSAYASDE